MRSNLVGVAVVVCALPAAALASDVIISNLNTGTGPGTAFGGGFTTQFKAAGFTTADAYFLDGVTIDVTNADIGGTADVEIWTGNGSPGGFLAQLSGDAFDAASGQFTFTADAPLVLEQGETYWIYVNNAAQDPVFTWVSSDVNPSGAGAAFVGYNFNGSPSSFMNMFEVTGTLVPAPGVATIGLVGVLAAGRRRR